MTAPHVPSAEVRASGNTAVIDLPPLIDGTAEAALNTAYAAALALGPRTVLLNFRRVDFLSSTGIALIVGMLARARKDGTRIAACDLNEHYRQIFEITRLADFMRIHPDEMTALTTNE